MDSRKILTLVLIIVVSMVMIFIQLKHYQNGDTNIVQGAAAAAFSPVQAFMSNIGRGISGTWTSFTRLALLEQENKQLRGELYALKEEQEVYNRTREENKNLRKLLDLAQQSRGKVLAAEVIARDPDNWFKSIKINKGLRDGVKKNMAVISSEGLVGRVISVSNDAAQVRLIFNEKSAVPAQLVSQGEMGVVYGEGGNNCVMKYVNADAKVEIGDKVMTSRLSRIYPPGKLIGTVSKVYGRDRFLYQSFQITPAVQFGNLEYVLLVEREE